jgi:DNA-binding CsgD family transcriptional regulator
MLDEGKLSGLIASIYDAALDAALWPAVIANVTAATNASTAGFISFNHAEGRAEIVPIGFDPDAARSYVDYYWQVDPFLPAVVSGTPGRVLTGRMLMSYDEWARTEIHNEWSVPNGVVETAALLIEQSPACTAAIAVGRGDVSRPFGSAEFEVLQILAPHLKRAFQVQRRLAASWQRNEALDRLRDGVVLVDRGARVLFANAAAEDLLKDKDGLRTDRGLLTAPFAAQTAALRALIAGQGGSLSLPRPRRAPLGIVVVPMRGEASWLIRDQPAALVFLADADGDAAPPDQRLQAMFGLTRAQAALAREIARGEGLDAAAERLGIARATARTHLADVFAKTGTRRQAELVRLLLRISPGLRDS